MTQNKYKFVSYQPEYKTQILHLLSVLWGEDQNQNRAYFDWKYQDNPYADEVRMTLAIHEGTVVGFRGFYAMCWQVGLSEKSVLCLGDADGFVDPDHRRKGLLGSMTHSAMDDAADSSYEYLVTLSANKITFGFNLSQGFQNVGFIQTAKRFWVRGDVPQGGLLRFARYVPGLPSMYRRLRSRSGSVPQEPTEAVPTFKEFDSNILALSKSSAGAISVTRLPRPGEMAELIEQTGDTRRIQHVRDQEYFAWRYQNPRSTYRFLYWSAEQLEGYMVLRTPVNATGGPVTIVDWAAKSLQVYEDLLEAAIELGKFAVINTWSETLPEAVKQLLNDNGFHFIDTEDEESSFFPPQILVRPVQDEELAAEWMFDGLDIVDIDNWNIQAIDSDGN